MERKSYDQLTGKIVVETIYDPTATIEANKESRADGDVVVGSKGQGMLLAARVDMDHITALKALGYDLLSPDPQEFRRALCFIQAEQSDWMATDKKVFSMKKPKWQ